MKKRISALSARNIENFDKNTNGSSKQYISSSPSDDKFVLVLKESSNTYHNLPPPASDEKKAPKIAPPVQKAGSMNDENNWPEVDYNQQSIQKGNYSFAFRKKKFQQTHTTLEEDEAALAFDKSKTIINRNIMMVGCRATGKHILIRSVVGKQSKEDISPPNQIMDLVVKTEEEGSIKTNYLLWLRTIDEHRFDHLVRLYYKKINVFVFFYCIHNEKSFEVLEEAIQAILQDVPREKFVGILLGNKTIMDDMESEREVSYADGLAMKEKYNLKLFFETDYNEECLAEQILSVLKV